MGIHQFPPSYRFRLEIAHARDRRHLGICDRHRYRRAVVCCYVKRSVKLGTVRQSSAPLGCLRGGFIVTSLAEESRLVGKSWPSRVADSAIPLPFPFSACLTLPPGLALLARLVFSFDFCPCISLCRGGSNITTYSYLFSFNIIIIFCSSQSPHHRNI